MRTASCMALCPTRYGSRSLWEAKRMSSGPAHPGVLVGVDGSPSSRVAVRWAAHEATVRNIPLTPVHVVSTPAASSSALSWPAVPIPAELRQWQEDESRKGHDRRDQARRRQRRRRCSARDQAELFFSAPVPTLDRSVQGDPASTRPNSTGNTNNSGGKIESHNVGWSFTVLSTMASIPSSPRG